MISLLTIVVTSKKKKGLDQLSAFVGMDGPLRLLHTSVMYVTCNACIYLCNDYNSFKKNIFDTFGLR